jgi:hypothetical protein
MSAIDVNDYDILYKKTIEWKIPSKFIITAKLDNNDLQNVKFYNGRNYKFANIKDYIVQEIDGNDNVNLVEIKDVLEQYLSSIDINDILLFYISTKLKVGADNKYLDDLDDKTITKIKYCLLNTPDFNSNILKTYKTDYKNWKTKLQIYIDDDAKILREFEEQKNIFNEIDKIDYKNQVHISPFMENKKILLVSGKLKSNYKIKINEDYGQFIFNSIVLSKNIPFICYNDYLSNGIYKIYNDNRPKNKIKLNKIIIKKEDTPIPNTIYFKLWYGDDKKLHFKNATDNSFTIGVYNIQTNILKVEIPSINNDIYLTDDELYNKISETFPEIDFNFKNTDIKNTDNDIKIMGNVNMYNVKFNEITFLHMFLIYDIMNRYFYIDESEKTTALRKSIILEYRGIFTGTKNTSKNSIASIKIKKSILDINDKFKIFNFKDNTITTYISKQKIDYLTLEITASSKYAIESVIYIFQKLMNIYKFLSPLLNSYYTNEIKINELNYDDTNDDPDKIVNIRNNKEFKILKDKMPEIFEESYLRICQKSTPTHIDDKDIENYTKQTFIQNPNKSTDNKSLIVNKQILKYPVKNSVLNLKCDSDPAYPYPGVMANTLPNKMEYPWIPCCFKLNKMEPSDKQGYLNYLKYLNNEAPGTTKFKSKIKNLDPNIIKLFNNKINNKNINFNILTISFSNNSIIECILTALSKTNIKYLSLDKQHEKELQQLISDFNTKTTENDKKIFIENFRTNLAQSPYINISALKQELYDYSNDQIIDLLIDNSDVFNYQYLYRALELFFDINIYVFIGEGHDISMVIPNNKLVHIRPLTNKNTIILYQVLDKSKTFPHYHLILANNSQNNTNTYIFNVQDDNFNQNNINTLCHEMLEYINTNLTFNNISTNFNGTSIFSRQNIYSINYDSIFNIDKYNIIYKSQFIDTNGKTRAITIDILNTNNDFITSLTLCIPPTQPLNISETSELTKIEYGLLKQLINILPTGFGKTLDISNNTDQLDYVIDGLWYNFMNIENGIFIPILYTEEDLAELNELNILQNHNYNPILSYGLNKVDNLMFLKKQLNIIVNVIKWCYDIYSTESTIKTASDFFKNYVLLDQRNLTTSNNFYHLENFPYKLPSSVKLQNALAELYNIATSNNNFIVEINSSQINSSQIISSKIISSKIISSQINNRYMLNMYNQDFYDKIYNMLLDYSTIPIGNFRYDFINNYYQYSSDYKQMPNTKIFTSYSELIKWQNNIDVSLNISIKNTIEEEFFIKNSNFIYISPTNRKYIVQKTFNSTLSYALYICNYWQNNKINLCTINTINDADFLNYKYIIYSLDNFKNIIPVDNNLTPTDLVKTALEVLFIGDYNPNEPKNFYSLLPLE